VQDGTPGGGLSAPAVLQLPATTPGWQGGSGCQHGVQHHAGDSPSPGRGAKHRGWDRGIAGAWLLRCDGHAGYVGLSVGAAGVPHACPVGPGARALGSQPEPVARGGLQGLSVGQVRAPSLQALGETQAGDSKAALAAAMCVVPAPATRQCKNGPLRLSRWSRRGRALLLQAPCQPPAQCRGLGGKQGHTALWGCPEPPVPLILLPGYPSATPAPLHLCPALLGVMAWHSMAWNGSSLSPPHGNQQGMSLPWLKL